MVAELGKVAESPFPSPKGGHLSMDVTNHEVRETRVEADELEQLAHVAAQVLFLGAGAVLLIDSLVEPLETVKPPVVRISARSRAETEP